MWSSCYLWWEEVVMRRFVGSALAVLLLGSGVPLGRVGAGGEVPVPPPEPVKPDSARVQPWTPGKVQDLPTPWPESPSAGPGTDKAPSFVDVIAKQGAGLETMPKVRDGQVLNAEVTEADVAKDVKSGRLGADVPMSIGAVPTDAVSVVGKERLASPAAVEVEVVAGERATAAGMLPFGFKVTDAVQGKEPSAVRVALDYSQFRYLEGGDWAGRLQLTEYPACALTDPDKPECLRGVVVPTVNDPVTGVIAADLKLGSDPGVAVDEVPIKDAVGGADQTVSDRPVDESTRAGSRLKAAARGFVPHGEVLGELSVAGGLVPQASGSGGSVYGWSAGYSSNAGSYAATPLSSAASWTAGGGMGSFDWSYPVPMPPSGFGAAPSVGFAYSSQAVDGVVLDENNQGLLGAGWTLASGGFIERTYTACTAQGGTISDFCWLSDNATISLNGHATELLFAGIPSAGVTEWRLKDDPGWKVQRFSGTSSTADNRNETWKVWSSDGTEYDFGLRNVNGLVTESVWTVPVIGNAGEPCAGSSCKQAWRWNLDRVRDRNGNIITYKYVAEKNHYRVGGGTWGIQQYDRGGYLAEIRYGAHESDPGAFRNKVVFNMIGRCTSNNPAVCMFYEASRVDPFYFDAPVGYMGSPPRLTGLECGSGSCLNDAPSFFTKMGLKSIETKVKEADVAVNGDFNGGPGVSGIWAPTGGGITNYAQYFAPTYPTAPTQAQATVGYLEMNTSGDNGAVFIDYPTETPVAGSTVTLSAWVRTNGGPGSPPFHAVLELYSLGGTYPSIGQNIVADSTWRQVEMTMPATSTTNVAFRVQVVMHTFGTQYSLDIDSIQIRTTNWRTVDTVTPVFDLPLAAVDQPAQFWLRTLQRTAAVTATTPQIDLPINLFHSYNSRKDNRADGLEFWMWRIDQIDDESGGRTTVTYNQQTAACVQGTGWQANTQDCYPRWIVNSDGSGGFAAFSRWMATSVTTSDLLDPTGSVPIQHLYFYQGTPEYHHDDNPNVSAAFRTWSDPRGYASVIELVGTYGGSQPYTLAQKWYFRGMNGDSNGPGVAPQATSVTYNDGAFTSAVDENQLRGTMYESVLYNPDTTPWTWQSHDATYFEVKNTAPFVLSYRVEQVMSRHWMGGASTPTEVQTLFDNPFGPNRPVRIWDRGDTATPADDTCTHIIYAGGAEAINLTSLVSNQIVMAGDINHSSTPAYGNCSPVAADELGVTFNLYDNAPANTTALTGRLTSTATRDSATAPIVNATTTSTYDNIYGRILSIDGPLAGTADKTTTTYDYYGFANSATDPTGHRVETFTDPGRGQPMWVNDMGGVNPGPSSDDRRVSTRYDALGRTLAVYTADGGQRAVEFTYTISPTKSAPSVVSTSVHQAGTQMLTTWAYVDGMGRTRETQAAAPNGGRLISGTRYNNRGEAVAGFANVHDAAAPGSGMWASGWPVALLTNESRVSYDHVGRVVLTQAYANNQPVLANNGTGNPLRTITQYNGLLTTVYPAEGQQTASLVNNRGQVKRTDAYNNIAIWTGPKSTSYDYDLHGNQTTITDPKGNTRTTTLNNFGQVKQTNDPDAGINTFSYLPNGAVSSVTNALNQNVTYTTDLLGRVTQVVSGGTVLESYLYDSLMMGQLTSATSGTGPQAMTVATNGFDLRGRPTGYTYTVGTIAGVTDTNGFAGAYVFDQFVYDRADHLVSYHSPPKSGVSLPDEVVTTGFNPQGFATTLARSNSLDLVTGTTFTNEGRIATRSLYGSSAATTITRGYSWDTATGMLRGTSVTQNNLVLQQDTNYQDALGQPTKVIHDRAEIPAVTTQDHDECFTYNGMRQLKTASTLQTSPGVTCGTTVGGPGSYDDGYAVDEIGNLMAGPNGAAYSYPASGPASVRPHAPNSAGTTTFIWDAAGRLQTKTAPPATTGGGSGGTTTTTTTPAATTTTTTVAGGGGTCSSQTYNWNGYQGLHVSAATFNTGVSIPAPAAGSTQKVTAMTVKTYDGQTAGTVPSRATQNETGEKIGIRIGSTDNTAITGDLPDTVAQGADNDNFSGVKTYNLAGWVNTPISGGQIVIRHGSLYTGTTASDSLSANDVTVTVETCTAGGGGTTTTTAGATTTTVAGGGGTCSSQTYTWTGYQGLHVGAATFATGVTIPAPAAGSTQKVTAMTVQTYDGQSPGTVPSRATQNETGEKIGIRIGAVDNTAITGDLPDTVAQGADTDNFSGVKSYNLTGWINTPITGGQIIIRHGSLYTGTTASDSLSANTVTIIVETCTAGGGATTTTTTPAGTTTTTTAPGGGSGTCSSQTYTWNGYQGIHVSANTYATGVTIPAPAAGSTQKVTAMSVQTYDAQTAGTVPSRATQNETGEKIGVRIGTTDNPALSGDLPDTVAQGADNDNYSGLKPYNLTGWVNTPIVGGQIIIRHGSLYTGSTASDSLSAFSVNVTVETCTAGGGTSAVTTNYTWNVLNQLTQVTGATTEKMWYLAGGERILHQDSEGIHLYLGGNTERHNKAGVTTDKRYYSIGSTTIAVRTNTSDANPNVDGTTYMFGDLRGSTTLTLKQNVLGANQQGWYTAYGAKRAGQIDATNRGYIGQTTDTSGLNYLHNRYQDPTTGIFLTVDPQITQTGQPYLYANGNPASLSDPSGLCAVGRGDNEHDDGKGPCGSANNREDRSGSGVGGPSRTVLMSIKHREYDWRIEQIGDISHAKNIVVFVPGAGTDLSNFETDVAQRTIEMMRAAGPGSAGIAWMAYDIPHADLQALSSDRADAATTWFGDYVSLLSKKYPDALITIAAHSYGTVVAGRSIADGQVEGSNIQLVTMGSPGYLVGDAQTERMKAWSGAVFDLAGSDDGVRNGFTWFGLGDHQHGSIVAQTYYEVPGGHSDYWKGASLAILGAIIDGNPPA